jgi:VanZ family protein
MGKVVLIYIAMLIYGSLYPFHWGAPSTPWMAFLSTPLPSHWDKGDVVQNVLVYMPLGLAVALWWTRGHGRFWAGVLGATLAGTLLSVGVETVQQFLPGRVASVPDILTNMAGSLIGALFAAAFRGHTPAGTWLLAWRDARFRSGPLANTALVALGLWVLSQTSPLVPSLDIAQLRHGLGLLLRQLRDPAALDIAKLVVAACHITALGLLLAVLALPRAAWLWAYALLLAFVLLCKLLVAGRVLSLEVLCGAALALALLPWLSRLPQRASAVLGVLLITLATVLYELAPAQYWVGASHHFNWIPFLGQMQGLNGFENILECLWPCMAMACLARYAVPVYQQDVVAVFGGVAVGVGLFSLEWMQLSIPGRSADITQVLLGCAGWAVPWFAAERARTSGRAGAPPMARQQRA